MPSYHSFGLYNLTSFCAVHGITRIACRSDHSTVQVAANILDGYVFSVAVPVAGVAKTPPLLPQEHDAAVHEV